MDHGSTHDGGAAQAQGNEQVLARQQVMLLQETHWKKNQGAVWGSGIMTHTAVVAAPARRCSEHGGPQGGVSILVPHPMKVIEQATMVEGCAVQARVQLPAPGVDGPAFTFISIYLPPAARGPRSFSC